MASANAHRGPEGVHRAFSRSWCPRSRVWPLSSGISRSPNKRGRVIYPLSRIFLPLQLEGLVQGNEGILNL